MFIVESFLSLTFQDFKIMQHNLPSTKDEVIHIIETALKTQRSLEVVCHKTKGSYGRPVDADQLLDMKNFSSVINYEPSELYIQCQPGAKVSDLSNILDQNNQCFAFEPPDWGPMFGSKADTGSIGGLVACNLAGSRRIKQGATRDHLLGFHAISGRGEEFKSGGTVVKNVAGFDLSKLMAGSLGTLAVMTQLTIKVIPKPEKARSILLYWPKGNSSDHPAIKVMTQALGSSYEVSGASHLPQSVVQRSKLNFVNGKNSAITALRVEGPKPSVEARCAALRKILIKFGETEELHTSNSQKFWKEISDVAIFSENTGQPLWRIMVPPAFGADIAEKVLKSMGGELFYDWGGGQIWLATEGYRNSMVPKLFEIVNNVGGEVNLIRGSKKVRSEIDVFMQKKPGILELTRKIKKAFDPEEILNPGRIYPPG